MVSWLKESVGRLPWLVLLVVPCSAWAQQAMDPPAVGDVPPAAAGDAPAPPAVDDEPGEGEQLPPGGQREAEEEAAVVVGVCCCCGFSILILIPLLLLSIYLIRRANDRKRTEALSKIALELGLDFQPDGDQELQSQFAGFDLAQKGRGRTLTNVCTGGTDEVRLWIFDYRFVTGYGKNRRVRSQTVTALESGQLRLPEFHLRPEEVIDRVSQLVGLRDINFEQHHRFSSQFVLQSKVSDETHEFFDNDLLDFFADRPGISIETRPQLFIIYQSRKLATPHDFRKVFEDGFTYFMALRERIERG